MRPVMNGRIALPETPTPVIQPIVGAAIQGGKMRVQYATRIGYMGPKTTPIIAICET